MENNNWLFCSVATHRKRNSLYQYCLLLSGKLAGAIITVCKTAACFPTSKFLNFIMK